jgi:endonuclease YncB( thermonuclease family)
MIKLVAVTLALFLVACERAQAEMPQPYRVIDGDTFAVKGVKYRLVGIDTPETYRPDCLDELILGGEATKFVRRLLTHSSVTFSPTGAEDIYKRKLVQIYVLGTNLSQLLIEVGLGKPFIPPAKKPTWCDKQ